MNFISKLFNKEEEIKEINYNKEFTYPKKGMHELIKESAIKHKKLKAFDYFGKETTYDKFYKQITNTAKALKYLGVNNKDRVTICMPNTPEAVILFYAINMIGATSNMVHPLSSENEIKYFMDVAESKYIFTLDMFIDKVIKATNSDITIIMSKVSESMPRHIKTIYDATQNFKNRNNTIDEDNIITWRDFYKLGFLYEDDDYYVKLRGDEEAVILYTGGTSGKPKGVQLSNNNFNSLAFSVLEETTNAKPGKTLLSPLPIFHGFGLACGIHSVYVAGANNALLPDYKTSNFVRTARRLKPHIILGVPTMYEAIISSNTFFPSLYLKNTTDIISGGDTLNSNLRKRINKHLSRYGSKTEIREGYGLTESVAVATLTPYFYYEENSIGRAISGVEVKLVKEGTDIEVKSGKKGEICISGPIVMMGYLNEEESTKETLRTHEDGKIWLHTGDVGYFNKDGILFFTSRMKRMIVSSGYNIYPNYIERVLETHPAINEAVVVGIPNSFRGEVVIANIVLKENFRYSSRLENDIKDHLRKSVAKYSMPYKFEVHKSLPKTLMLKINYKKLEELNRKKYEK